jgi:hypothetical protein
MMMMMIKDTNNKRRSITVYTVATGLPGYDNWLKYSVFSLHLHFQKGSEAPPPPIRPLSLSTR